MNYLWEAVFMADGQGIPRERIRFLAAKDYRPIWKYRICS